MKVAAAHTATMSVTAPVNAARWRSDKHEDATVETNGLAIVQGMVLRQHLIALLKHRGYGHKIGNMVAKNELALDELTQDYPRWPKISSVDVPKEDYDMWMDLRPYMNPSPYLVQASCSLAKIFRLFRTMGLRHLVVVNKMNELVGLVTRKDLANITNDMKREDFLHSRLSVRHVKYIMPENITDDVDAVLIRDREDHPRVEDLGQNGPDDSIMPMN